MSNQNATQNRVTLLESIESAKNAVMNVATFHQIDIADSSNATRIVTGLVVDAWKSLRRAAIVAAELEAWGDGP